MDLHQILRSFAILAATFLVMTLVWNLNPRFPRMPYDPFVSKLGFSLYLPVFSAVVIAVILTFFLNLAGLK